MLRHLLLLMTLIAPASAAVIYDNTTTDSGETIFFSAGPYTEIGDTVSMGGVDRASLTAAVQFFNAGSQGAFDAVLRFYAASAPVGAALYPDFVYSGILAPELDSFTVTFDTLGALVPDEFVFTVEIRNVAAGLDLGLNLYDPPGAIGSSSTSSLIVRNSSFSQQAAGTNSNLFFQLNADGAADVPEPSTLLLMPAASAILLLANRRRLR